MYDFDTLPGDADKDCPVYGPQSVPATFSPAQAPTAVEDGQEIHLFESDEEDEAEAARIRDERLAEYRKKKAAKPQVAAKSVVVLDVKPWDNETDMIALENAVRGIEKDGLAWGGSNLVPVGFGIKMLQIQLVIEDEKVSLVELEEEIQGFEEWVQSTDVASMNKL